VTLTDLLNLAARLRATGDSEAAAALQVAHDALLCAAAAGGFEGSDQLAHRAGQYLRWAEDGPPGTGGSVETDGAGRGLTNGDAEGYNLGSSLGSEMATSTATTYARGLPPPLPSAR